MKLLIIDNYDSFTYNLYQYVGEIMSAMGESFTLDVVRNDELSLAQIKKRNYERVIISPGPGNPADLAYFGVCADVLTKLGKKIPVLGVCLGMQGMAHYFGGSVVRATLPMHGKTSMLEHDGKGVFAGLPQRIEIMRYHSLVADPKMLSKDLEITATVAINVAVAQLERQIEIMGLRHKSYPIEGIQFHPESFATEGGKRMLSNFLFQQ